MTLLEHALSQSLTFCGSFCHVRDFFLKTRESLDGNFSLATRKPEGRSLGLSIPLATKVISLYLSLSFFMAFLTELLSWEVAHTIML